MPRKNNPDGRKTVASLAGKPKRADVKRRHAPNDGSWETAIRYHQQGNLKQAESAYIRILISQSKNAALLGNLGAAFRGQGKLDEAIACYRRAIKINPDDSQIYSNLGNALSDLGDMEKASACYLKAIKNDPDYGKAWFNLANALQAQGKLDEAMRKYEKALSLEPSYIEACMRLSAIKKSLGDEIGARKILNHGIRNNPRYSIQCVGKAKASVLILMGFQDCDLDLTDDNAPRIAGGHFSTVEFINKDQFTQHMFLILDNNLMKHKDNLPDYDIIINSIACPDREARSLKAVSRFILDRGDIPIINHPDEVLKTTRNNNYMRLKKIDGLTFPKTIRLSIKKLSDSEIIEKITKSGFKAPFIIRRVGTQTAVSTRKIEHIDEVNNYLSETEGDTFYVITYVENLFRGEYHRKLRVFCIDGKLYPVVCHIDKVWNVHGGNRKSMMKKNKWMQDEEKKFLSDCKGYIGAKNYKILEGLYDEIRLDFFGIDFTILADNSIIIFELNPAMRHSFDHSRNFPYMLPYLKKISTAFKKMVLRKLG